MYVYCIYIVCVFPSSQLDPTVIMAIIYDNFSTRGDHLQSSCMILMF